MGNFNIITNLVSRAFPSKIGWGGKRPWHRLVTCPLLHPKKPGCNKLALCEKLKLRVTSQSAILGDLLYLRKVLHDFLFSVTDTGYCNFLLSSDFYEGESEW